MMRDPKWTPAIGDIFTYMTASGTPLFRVVVGVVGDGLYRQVVYRRGRLPGAGRPKWVPWSTWRAFVRHATYIGQEDVPHELRSP